ncbi:O-methyltransferase [Colletotrichum truncatum]|uniref:O-methyltransferase n=1 Tax=Colletotrichum truncatum TaxID=5467 RepID=A0ACC3YCK2_COLTU
MNLPQEDVASPRSVENCHKLRQLATNLLGAVTEYTLRGNMSGTQETSLKSRIVSITQDIRSLVKDPNDQWQLHNIQSHKMAAIKLFFSWHVFEHIPLYQSISYVQLSDLLSVDFPLLVRVARMLISTGVLEEDGPDRVAHTVNSRIFLPDNPYGNLNQVVLEYGLSNCHAVQYFDKNGRKEPDGVGPSPFTFTNGLLDSNIWNIYEDQTKADIFMRAMTALDRFAPITGTGLYSFAWIANASTTEDSKRPLLVDVGGGRGHAVEAICRSTGLSLERCVLQDKEPVISKLKGSERLSGLQLMSIDMHKEQPVKGALVYYIRHCLHDYSDDVARGILRNISDAMTADSTLLIAEQVIGWPPKPESTAMDMLMLAVGGKERTEAEWHRLLQSSGLVLARIHETPGSSHCVIKCIKAAPTTPN